MRRHDGACTLAAMSLSIGQLLGEVESRYGVSAADGVQLLSVSALLARPFDPGIALILAPDASRPVTPLPGRAAHAGSAAQMLRALYPADHPVHPIQDGPPATVAEVSDEEL